MSEPNNIDMFKNDVRYRDNIAHVETIPAKEASFKKVENLNEKIVRYLDSKGVSLYKHQAETYEAIKDGENVIITSYMLFLRSNLLIPLAMVAFPCGSISAISTFFCVAREAARFMHVVVFPTPPF